MYLRCLTGDRPRQWLEWLPWVEYCYNMAYHTALCDTSFKVAYGRSPPSLASYEEGAGKLVAVEAQLRDRVQFLSDIRE